MIALARVEVNTVTRALGRNTACPLGERQKELNRRYRDTEAPNTPDDAQHLIGCGGWL